MPDLPTTETTVAPQVQPSAEMPMNVTPASLGAGIGEAAENAAEVATKIHRDAIARANQTATLDADNQKNAFLQSRLYDPKTGILSQNLGKDAPAAVDQTLSDYDAHVAKVTDGLSNDEQKIQFQRMAQATRFDLQRQLAHYEHGETTRYADQVDSSAIAGTTNAAIHNAHDPEQVSVELAKQRAIIADAGARKGLPPETIAEQQAAAGSATHLAVLEQLTSTGQDIAAKQWYDANKDQLDGKDATTAARLVEAGSLAGQATRISDELVLAKDGTVADRATIDERVRTDPRLADPKLRDEVQTRVDRRLAQHHEEVQEAQKATLDEALNTAQSSPLGAYDPRVVALKAKMDPEVRARFDTASAKEFKITSDPVAVNRLLVQSARDPQGFIESMKAPDLATRFAKGDLESLLARRQEILSKGSVSDAPGIFTREEEIKRGLTAAGLAGVKDGDPRKAQFLDALDARVKATEAATGRKAQPDDVRKAVDAITIETVVQPKGTLYGFNAARPVYQLTPEQRDSASRDLKAYEQVDPARAAQVRTNLVEGARRLGVRSDQVSEDQYNRAFAQMLIARDLVASGDRVGAQHAVDRLNDVLREQAKRADDQKAAAAAEDPDSFLNRLGRGLSAGGGGY